MTAATYSRQAPGGVPTRNQVHVPRAPHVVFSGGATGGHLFPGLAVAERLALADGRLRITFAGQGKAWEQAQVARAGFEYLALPCLPTPQSPWSAWRFLRSHLVGYREASAFARATAVSAVVGLGGYSSVPMARVAARHRLPLVLLEQNVVPGRATRWLARSATWVCASFAETASALPFPNRVRVTGNPLRLQFRSLATSPEMCLPTASDLTRPRRLIILGGSGGDELLNQHAPKAIYKLGAALAGWEIVHQTGKRGHENTRTLYRKLGLSATVTPFIEQMAAVLSESDLALSVAGGGTLAELAAAGVPAVLVPLAHALDDHQRLNAEALAAGGSARVVDARSVRGRIDEALVASLAPLVRDERARLKMRHAMLCAARPEAALRVARLIQDVLAAVEP